MWLTKIFMHIFSGLIAISAAAFGLLAIIIIAFAIIEFPSEIFYILLVSAILLFGLTRRLFQAYLALDERAANLSFKQGYKEYRESDGEKIKTAVAEKPALIPRQPKDTSSNPKGFVTLLQQENDVSAPPGRRHFLRDKSRSADHMQQKIAEESHATEHEQSITPRHHKLTSANQLESTAVEHSPREDAHQLLAFIERIEAPARFEPIEPTIYQILVVMSLLERKGQCTRNELVDVLSAGSAALRESVAVDLRKHVLPTLDENRIITHASLYEIIRLMVSIGDEQQIQAAKIACKEKFSSLTKQLSIRLNKDRLVLYEEAFALACRAKNINDKVNEVNAGNTLEQDKPALLQGKPNVQNELTEVEKISDHTRKQLLETAKDNIQYTQDLRRLLMFINDVKASPRFEPAIYQVLVIRSLLERNGQATVSELADILSGGNVPVQKYFVIDLRMYIISMLEKHQGIHYSALDEKLHLALRAWDDEHVAVVKNACKEKFYSLIKQQTVKHSVGEGKLQQYEKAFALACRSEEASSEALANQSYGHAEVQTAHTPELASEQVLDAKQEDNIAVQEASDAQIIRFFDDYAPKTLGELKKARRALWHVTLSSYEVIQRVQQELKRIDTKIRDLEAFTINLPERIEKVTTLESVQQLREEVEATIDLFDGMDREYLQDDLDALRAMEQSLQSVAHHEPSKTSASDTAEQNERASPQQEYLLQSQLVEAPSEQQVTDMQLVVHSPEANLIEQQEPNVEHEQTARLVDSDHAKEQLPEAAEDDVQGTHNPRRLLMFVNQVEASPRFEPAIHQILVIMSLLERNGQTTVSELAKVLATGNVVLQEYLAVDLRKHIVPMLERRQVVSYSALHEVLSLALDMWDEQHIGAVKIACKEKFNRLVKQQSARLSKEKLVSYEQAFALACRSEDAYNRASVEKEYDSRASQATHTPALMPKQVRATVHTEHSPSFQKANDAQIIRFIEDYARAKTLEKLKKSHGKLQRLTLSSYGIRQRVEQELRQIEARIQELESFLSTLPERTHQVTTLESAQQLYEEIESKLDLFEGANRQNLQHNLDEVKAIEQSLRNKRRQQMPDINSSKTSTRVSNEVPPSATATETSQPDASQSFVDTLAERMANVLDAASVKTLRNEVLLKLPQVDSAEQQRLQDYYQHLTQLENLFQLIEANNPDKASLLEHLAEHISQPLSRQQQNLLDDTLANWRSCLAEVPAASSIGLSEASAGLLAPPPPSEPRASFAFAAPTPKPPPPVAAFKAELRGKVTADQAASLELHLSRSEADSPLSLQSLQLTLRGESQSFDLTGNRLEIAEQTLPISVESWFHSPYAEDVKAILHYQKADATTAQLEVVTALQSQEIYKQDNILGDLL